MLFIVIIIVDLLVILISTLGSYGEKERQEEKDLWEKITGGKYK